MTTETVVALVGLVTAFFTGLATCLTLILRITEQMRQNQRHIAQNTAAINGHSTLVPPDDTPIG